MGRGGAWPVGGGCTARAVQLGDAPVLLARGFPELAVDVAQFIQALPSLAGSVQALLAAPGKCLRHLLKLAFSLDFARLESARCMTAGEGVSRSIVGCPAASCCLRAGEAGGRAGQDAAEEQGGRAGFQAPATGTHGAGGTAGGCQAMATGWHVLLGA